MECPNCGKELAPPGLTCSWCRVLVSNPGAGCIAGAGRRLGAYLLDALVGFVIALAIGAAMGAEEGVAFAALGFLGIIVANLYFMAKGTSIGKSILKMRVYRLNGKPAGFLVMLARESIGKIISGLLFSLGFLWMLWDRDVQAWHDKIVSTVVIWEKHP